MGQTGSLSVESGDPLTARSIPLVLRIYVAAVCLASTVFALHDAPLFLRARQQAMNAEREEMRLRDRMLDPGIVAFWEGVKKASDSAESTEQLRIARESLETARDELAAALREKSFADD